MDEALLAQVERPSRYLGNELNSVRKDLSKVHTKVALAYPDLYEIGMSNTGLHILYYMLNEQEGVAAERVYLPGRDLEAILKRDGLPLTTLENRLPLAELDVLGIQIPHELSYANIVKMLRLAQISLWTSERRDEEPLILGGGPGAFGPEAVAPFYDAILLGDAEDAFLEILDCVREARAEGLPRPALHQRLAKITGVYVPSLYEVEYENETQVGSVRPRSDLPENAAPPLVHKALIEDLEEAFYPEQAIVPFAETVHTRLGVEVMRGCTVGCRFCQAGMIYRPLRERSPRRILDLAACGLSATGYEDVSLLSLDTGDYTLIDSLTRDLLQQTAGKRVALSLPSLRAGSLTDEVIRDVRQVRRTSFTIAPEAGSQRLRDVINKNISDHEIFETVERVAKNGWTALKMYFMVGFPTETYEDLQGLVDLVVKCRNLGRTYSKRFSCTASLGTLVPKPQTPFQWDPQLTQDESRRRCHFVADQLRDRGIRAKFHDPWHSWLEGVFSRSDRRLAPIVADAEARGAGFESWDSQLDVELWKQVFADHGVDPEQGLRKRDYAETLPWDHLSARVTKKYLLGDRKKVDRAAKNPKVSLTTFDCRDDLCAGCAVCFEGDVRNRLAKYHADPFRDGRRLPLAQSQVPGAEARDQAAKAGEDALLAKRRRRRPEKPGKRRWAVTPGAPGAVGPAEAFSPEALARAESEVAEAEPQAPQAPLAPLPQPGRTQEPERPEYHFRLSYERRGRVRWLSHRELQRAFYRALQRSELPLVFTQGFHPKPRIAFGPPLPVGAESLVEELDLWLLEELSCEEILAGFRAALPHTPAEGKQPAEGLLPTSVEPREGKRSAHSERTGARWRVDLSSLGLSGAGLKEALEAFAAREAWNVDVPRHERTPRHVDLKQILERVELEGDFLSFDLLNPQEGSAKPKQVMSFFTGLPVERTEQGDYLMIEALRAPRVAPCA